ncbi:hypothetical protein DIE18_12610 [Burkholderia sp. Bp9125]|nr:hypothetical protein DIE18_12610 [Burkholderia sp. Bp9125]
MFQNKNETLIERYELALVELRRDGDTTLHVPVVSGWLEIQLILSAIPDANEQRLFFGALAALRASLGAVRPEMSWYFLHKSPGLKLRFRLGFEEPLILGSAVEAVGAWNFPWIGGMALGSVFDQQALLTAAYRPEIEKLLTSAADNYLTAIRDGKHCVVQTWTAFLIDLLRLIGLDDWLVYEALSRLRRLRTVEVGRQPVSGACLLDPRGMLDEFGRSWRAGFEASVSLLQALNLMLNMWAVDGVTQLEILERCCDLTRPSLLIGEP